MTYEGLIRRLGFTQDPFSSWDADTEERLEDYFIRPPFFNAVYGEPERPSSAVVFAPRGGGKSALRRMVELSSPRDNIICVTYSNPPTAGLGLASIDLAYHLQNIIVLVLVGLVGHLVVEKRYKNLSGGSRKALYWLLKGHLSGLRQADLRSAILAVRAMSQTAVEWWNSAIKLANPIFVTVTSALGIPAPELTLFENDQIDLGPLSDQLAFLAEIATESGARAVYVLVDRVDENDLTGNDATKAFSFIKPLLQNLSVLQTRGFGFKFFLWDLLRDQFREHGRSDRIKTFDLQWNEAQIVEMLASRIAAYSDHTHTSFRSLVDYLGDADLDFMIAFLAHGSPRNAIRMGQEILAQQAEINADMDRISVEAFQRGIAVFAQKYSEEVIPERLLRDLLKVGRIDFTVLHMYRAVFKISQQAGLQKIQQWGNRGIVAQIGTQKSNEGSRSNHYGIVDPLFAKYLASNLNVFEFTDVKVRRCPKCSTINIRDFDFTPTQACIVCQRDLDSANEGKLW